jgi:hypothetical protein
VKEMVVVAGNQELLDGLKVRAHCDAHPAHIAHFTLHTSCRPPPSRRTPHIATAHCHLLRTFSALLAHFSLALPLLRSLPSPSSPPLSSPPPPPLPLPQRLPGPRRIFEGGV